MVVVYNDHPDDLICAWYIHMGLSAPLLQLCLTLCNPMDCSPPGSSVHGILWARILEWVTMLFSKDSSQARDQTQRLLCLLHLLHWRLSFYHWATGEAMYICVYIYIMFYVIFYIQYRCSWTIERHWTTEEDPTQGAPLSDWCTNLQHRTLARGVPLCAWHREK